MFRALLYGGLRETNQPQIELKDTNVAAFKALLRYIYTGKASLTNLKVNYIFLMTRKEHYNHYKPAESQNLL